jgi:hypothetical protein
MSDRDNEPLFQNMDEQERIYAPEQVPGTDIPAEERDRGGTAGESAARDDDAARPVIGAVRGAAGISGSSAGSTGTGGPGVVPVIPTRDELDADAEREAREDERS